MFNDFELKVIRIAILSKLHEECDTTDEWELQDPDRPHRIMQYKIILKKLENKP